MVWFGGYYMSRSKSSSLRHVVLEILSSSRPILFSNQLEPYHPLTPHPLTNSPYSANFFTSSAFSYSNMYNDTHTPDPNFSNATRNLEFKIYIDINSTHVHSWIAFHDPIVDNLPNSSGSEYLNRIKCGRHLKIIHLWWWAKEEWEIRCEGLRTTEEVGYSQGET